MQFIKTPIPQLMLVDLEPHTDFRGFFARAWCQQELSRQGLPAECCQVNLCHSARRGTLRGMHFQQPPYGEAKFFRVVRGVVHDVVFDMRQSSPTCGRWFSAELNAVNRRAIFIPKGCAHGYLTLTDDTEVLYLVSTAYRPDASRGIRWDAEKLRGAWPCAPLIMSPQDASWSAEFTPLPAEPATGAA